MEREELLLRAAYQAFNNRNIDSVLAFLDPEVDWPNGMEGGWEHGHEAVRAYWIRQWKMVDPLVEPLNIAQTSDHEFKVTVQQTVRNLEGMILSDRIVFHHYQFEKNLIRKMEIEIPEEN